MTQYLSIEPLREPNDAGELDDAGRLMCEFGVVCLKRFSPSYLQELVAILVAAGVGVEGVTIFAGSKAVLPRTGAVLHVKPTGGVAPMGTHNDGAAAYRRPGAQLIAHAETWSSAEALAQAAYGALVAVRNRAVVA